MATSTYVPNFLHTLIRVFSLTNTFVSDSKHAFAALALEFEALHFLAQILVQRLEFVFSLHSAVRASHVGRLAIVALSTRQTKHVFAFTAHYGIKTEAYTN